MSCNITYVATKCNRVNCDPAGIVKNHLNVNTAKAACLLLQKARQLIKSRKHLVLSGLLWGATIGFVIGCNLWTFSERLQVNWG